MEKYYINVGRAADLKDSKERFIYRLLEILPGALVWLTLIGMVVLSWLRPVWVSFFIIGFCLFWLIRITHFSIHLIFAYRQMKKNLKIDWLEKLEQLENKNWQDIYHLVILPMYKEELKIVRETFESLASCQYPKEKIIVVLATEERAGQAAKDTAHAILNEFGDKFFRLLVTCHPQGLPGEIAGKGSNETWAGRETKEKIIDPLQIPYENIIVSAFDIDTQIFPQYFSCLTYYFLTASNPWRSSFQPIPLYLNNVWQAPFFSRVVAFSNIFWQAFQQQRPEKLVTYSSHSISFKALVEMNFWQVNVVSEDAGIFWKSFLFYDGDYNIIPIHYPISMDCVKSKTFRGTIANQYKQQRRWAWGSEGIPYLFFGFLKNKKIPLAKKFRYGFLLIEAFWAWGTNAILILFLGWLPLMLGGENFKSTLLSYNLPKLTGNIMTLALSGLVICVIISLQMLSFRPQSAGSNWTKKFLMIFQWVFFPIAFIVFGAFPAIDAQTRLMLGKYMGFWVTEKARKEKS